MTQSHSDPTSPAAIARKLTQRQKAALLWLPADGTWKPQEKGKGGPTMISLIYRMIVTEKYEPIGPRGGYRGSYALTPLGIRVRAAVEAGDGT